jgi:tRNA U34 5-methylaminomethyl-2-thiouridine-forming methyltransferase MnmC
MSLTLQISNDGSHTVYADGFGETYHSVNGAITESNHVFIDAGLNQVNKSSVNVLEIGFGTGLNAFLTLLQAEKKGLAIYYETLELFPVEDAVYASLNYAEVLHAGKATFTLLHQSNWEEVIAITPHFTIQKHKIDIPSFLYPADSYDVVYFDAFSPVTQPELWTQELFTSIYTSMRVGGVLTTYCAKGEVRRNMQRAGFTVERLPGPPGKREMLRATKR